MVSLAIPELTIFAISAAIFVATASVSVPFSGTLIRFRANYNPRGLALDAEGGAAPHTGPVVSSYFGTMKRVHRIEVSTYLQCLGFANNDC